MDPMALAKAINDNFNPPFVDHDLVRAWVNNRGDFCLRISARDIQLGADGSFIGAGTYLKEG